MKDSENLPFYTRTNKWNEMNFSINNNNSLSPTLRNKIDSHRRILVQLQLLPSCPTPMQEYPNSGSLVHRHNCKYEDLFSFKKY